jgi:hypothetical protein
MMDLTAGNSLETYGWKYNLNENKIMVCKRHLERCSLLKDLGDPTFN